MQLLLYLAGSAGAVVSVDHLLAEVWPGVIVGSASVYQAVSQLRKLLGDADPNPTYIATIPRKGYRLIAPVRYIDPAGPSSGATPSPAIRGAAPTESGGRAATPTIPRRLTPLVLGSAALIALVLAGSLIWQKWTGFAPSAKSIGSIVVLPFTDLTAGKTDQSFCDGLTEELSSWLSQIPTLRVVARTSAFAFRGQGQDVRKIGSALDTDHVLEGSMRRDGNRMRITVQLIDARNGYHLWSENFDRPIDDTIKIQEDIARSVAATLQVRLSSDSERQFAARRSVDPHVYQMYLVARSYDQQATLQSTDLAADLYRQVVNVDPTFSLAYVRLARALLNQRQFHDIPLADVAAAMEPLIVKALSLDDRLSGAYAIRGALRASQSREKDALDDLRLAISLNPSDMGAFASIGRLRLLDGQPREALQSYDHAAALDPLNSRLQLPRCSALEDLARYDEAAEACERARVLQPGSAAVADRLSWLAESQGRIDEALRWNAQSLKIEPSDDFEYYATRAKLFLSVGLAAPAHKVVQLGRSATRIEDEANAALVRVVFLEGGTDALRSYVASAHLEESSHAATLFEAAYSRMLLGDAPAAKALIARALAAPDRDPGFAEIPWYARNAGAGSSYRVDLAVAELQLGDRGSAEKDLDMVLAMVNRMIAAGVERNATYELRAKIYALKGQDAEAMRDLDRAVKLGWRRTWWAAHEPYLASLRNRSDFQALLAQVKQSNDLLIEKLKTDASIY
jgi:TolB-like protein/DNA-binding winged helix-turn-helix (wHTH) protein/tetratricopeptide (TPR) repeat protein